MSGEGANATPILKPFYLPKRQKRLLDIVVSGIEDVDSIAELLGLKREDIMRDIEELRAKNLLKVEREQRDLYVLTQEGARYLEEGLPEKRVLELLKEFRRLKRSEIVEKASEKGVALSDREANIGLAQLAKLKAVKFEGNTVSLAAGASDAEKFIGDVEKSLRRIQEGGSVDEGVLKQLRRRKLVAKKERSLIRVKPTELLKELYSRGLVRVGDVITTLTPEIIVSGKWRESVFKPFDLSVVPPRIPYGRKHPYLEFLDWIREILVSMGFEEMKGPHVEMELWNFDALFQAQDHPAREIHDTYFIKGELKGRFDDKDYLERLAATHEYGWETGSKGWGYKWDPQRALRLVLRTQTTAVSMRTIYERGEGEYMCFSLDRVFRPENLDAKHSMEFYQLEGIIVGRKVTFRNLLGFFQEMADRLGLGKVKVKPAYFPFTEPSVEGFIKHPSLGWIEVFPGGMFRPEVIMPLGLKEVNVAAWGIGIDRIAMTVLGIDDIRLLFAQDVDFIRRSPRPIIRELVR